jgi:hypothetical protein
MVYLPSFVPDIVEKNAVPEEKQPRSRDPTVDMGIEGTRWRIGDHDINPPRVVCALEVASDQPNIIHSIEVFSDNPGHVLVHDSNDNLNE